MAALQPPIIAPESGWVHAPALVMLSNANPSGVIFYTVDGSDPRDRFGNVARNARVYQPALPIVSEPLDGGACARES